jgi:UPF0271 protein
MEQRIIDINADVGEGLNNEAQLMPYLSSCNIACGGHAGDKETMLQVVRLAKQNKVKIGAHPSFPDKPHFGRRIMEMPSAELYTSLKQQVRNLIRVLRIEHSALHHVKPHGALYNLATTDEKTAKIIIEVVKSIALPLYLYVPYGSVIADLAKKEHIKITYEAFADRNYNADLTLVSRTQDSAVITDPGTVFQHVRRMIFDEKVKTISGVEVPIKASTFCLHGDNPEAVTLLQNLVEKLNENHVVIM